MTSRAAQCSYEGDIYLKSGDVARAAAMYTEALNLFEAMGDKGAVARQYGNLSNIYAVQGEFARREEMLLNALKIFEELGDEPDMARTYGNLGNAYREKGDLVRAENMLTRALKLFEKLRDTANLAATHATLVSRGVASYDRSALDADYRLSVLFLIMRPVNQQAFDIPVVIWWNNLERILLAVEDLGCEDLL